MGVFTRIEPADAALVAAVYDLGAFRTVTGIPAGSVNSNYALECTKGRFFLRIYEEQDARGAAGEARMLATLSARGVLTPAPLATLGGESPTVQGKPLAVFPWRDGEMRCQRSVTPRDARALGVELARVHAAGEGVEATDGRFTVDDLRARIDVIAGASDPTLAAQAPVLAEKLDLWSGRRGELPRGLIHGDLFRDNVLWKGEAISALLDFESASRGPFAFDVMVTVLSWAFGAELEPSIARAILDGYRTVRELEPSERDALLAEGCFAATRFAITRVTDYAMKQGIGNRVIKDWKRFAMRLATLEALGNDGLARTLGL